MKTEAVLIDDDFHHSKSGTLDSISKLQDIVMRTDFIDKCDTKDNSKRALKEANISLI